MRSVTTDAGDQLSLENAALRAELAEMQARIVLLERLADSDTLTPLPNRRFFIRELERMIAQVERHGTPAALLFVDMDGLKRINDAHGHSAGDAALKHVAHLLREQVRASDVVARIGGDEFGLLLDHLDEAAAHEKAVSLCEAMLANPLEGRIEITISVGLTPVKPGDRPEAALARADGAMYRVKRQPR